MRQTATPMTSSALFHRDTVENLLNPTIQNRRITASHARIGNRPSAIGQLNRLHNRRPLGTRAVARSPVSCCTRRINDRAVICTLVVVVYEDWRLVRDYIVRVARLRRTRWQHGVDHGPELGDDQLHRSLAIDECRR